MAEALSRARERRLSSGQRGYGREWREKIRPRVLRAHGIPKADWPKYDIDHRPAYAPEVEPDHNKYELVPMLRSEHSRKTSRFDGGFGNGRGPSGEGGIESSQPERGDRGVEASIAEDSKIIGGSDG